MNNPFIPSKQADLVIVAGNISDEIYENLKVRDLKIIKTIPHKGVDSSIAYHPDIVIHPINHKTLIIEPTVYNYYKEELKNTDLKIIKGKKTLTAKYPDDIAYNVGRIANFALHNLKHTDEVLTYYLKKEGIELVNIRQGYSKCSMAIIGLNEIITADRLIDKLARKLGIDSLLIQPGNINLQNQKYGFIGGCTGNMSNEEILISGNLNKHPDKERIENFINRLNKRITYLSQAAIGDIGTIITLNSKL